MKAGRFVLAVAALLGAPAVAAPSAHTLALAAGYKAAFLCSNIFIAGQTEAQATANDLTGIYPEYEPLVSMMPAVIDTAAKTVSVAFDAKMPPRVAAWRPLLGCGQMPIGADPAATALLPKLSLTPPDLAVTDARAWPFGDARAFAPKAKRPELDRIVAAAFDHASYGKGSETTAVIVLVDDKIVAERYRPDFDMHTPQRTWSVAKSLAATLVGRAVLAGKLAVADPVGLPEWKAPGDPRAPITFEQLLRMNSGLWTDGPGNRTDEIYVGGSTVPQAAASRPLEALPGTRFRYANDDILLAAYGLRLRFGQEALAFPFLGLLLPLGMTRTTPETDVQGNYILSSQVWMTARDVARLALLYQNDGIAPGGERLLPKDWIKFVSTPAGAQPEGATGGYGAGFWLSGAAQGVPAGTYSMDGNRGQYAIIVPSAKVIVVRRGYDAPGARFEQLKFTAAVLAALTPGK